ncbi:MAG: M56 family metallopeptidase [Schaedlerella sp.]|nr:M56 family metallopeptidase [uncultured Schaedlerella sp.]
MLTNFLLIMSLSGSVILLLYLLVSPIAKRYFSLAWRYRILKIALAFYLIPFPAVLPEIRDSIFGFCPLAVDLLSRPVSLMNTSYAIYADGGSLYVSSGLEKMLIFILGMGVLSFAVISWYALRYWKMRKICLNYSDIPVGQKQQDIFHSIKNELDIRRNVKLLCSEYCKVPITMGICSPTVIIPPWNRDEVDQDLYHDVLKHELVHIKHRDVLIRFLGIAAIAVHWFNPFTYILYNEILNISEIYCDSIVLRGKEEQERKAYGELLLKLAVQKSMASNEFAVGILGGNSKRAFKRRIVEMKTVRKNKRILSALITALISLMGGLTVCAYDPPVNITDHGPVYAEQGFDFQFTVGELKLEVEELPYEQFFVDDAGNVYEIKGDSNDTRAACKHKYVAGTTTSHSKNSSGGCTVTVYEAQRCLLCGYIKKGDKINLITYEKCLH